MPGQLATWQGRSGVWEVRPLTPAPSEEAETLLQVVSSDGVLYIRTPAGTLYGYLVEQGSKSLVQHRYAEVNGVRLHCATGGQGKLLLFLHGFPEFHGVLGGTGGEIDNYCKTMPAAKGKTTEKPKEHQATGTVVSSSTTSLVISKRAGASKSEWTFVVNDKTKTQGTVARDAKAVVYYHQEGDQKIADRVKVLSAMGSAGAAKGSKAAKTKS